MMNARNMKFLIVGLLAILPIAAQAQDLVPPPPQAAPEGYIQMQNAPPGTPATDPNAMPMMSQNPMPLSPTPPPAPPVAESSFGAPTPGMGMPQQQAYTQQQIDQLVAPIALYPDPLVAQILMASTYPLEVVEAQRWRENPQNAALTGPQLQAALEQQPWDPSVKSLIAFPQVLAMMNNNLQWTEQLGDAFLGSQPQLMDEVQNLRHRAEVAGNLRSTPQETVSQDQGEVIIQPASPQVVYVPYYNPAVVYGPWPWAAYPPYYFPPPPGYVYASVGLFGFGLGIAVFDWAWGWNHWDWYHHSIIINQGRFAVLNGGRPSHFAAGGAWAHDVDHRHGVPYRSVAARQQFQGAATQARAGYRGYFNTPNGAAGNFHTVAASGAQRSAEQPQARFGLTHSTVGQTGQTQGQRSFAQSRTVGASAAQSRPMQQQTQQRTTQSRSAPMFESFSRGSDVRAQAARGSTSRASMQSFSRPESHAAPAARTSGGGGERGGQETRH